MASFQRIVITCAIIVLIISFIFISFNIVYAQQEASWPPLVGDCPDYWIDTSGKGASCVNVKNLGTCKAPQGESQLTMDFTSSAFTGKNAMCAKYNWANSCGVSWDGITYGVSNPCNK